MVRDLGGPLPILLRPTESLYGVATVLSGIPLYYFWRRSPQFPAQTLIRLVNISSTEMQQMKLHGGIGS